ncbi:MAG: thiamine-phosphate kinase [bacterium]
MAHSARTLAEVGESALIERIARRAGSPAGRDWPLSIGDDAAILRPRAGQDLVLSVDVVVEDVHFRFERETPRGIGRRALVVNLSDLAAMGAAPVGCLLSLTAPRSLPLTVFDGLIEGVVEEARRHACPLVGGNLSAASVVSLALTVVGRVERGRALRRGRVRAGDRLFVTGLLGVGALARLRADRTGSSLRHVPTPRLEAGRALVRRRATGCVDLSDGLATDLVHLLEGTGLGAEIEPGALPRPKGFDRACRRLDVDPMELLCAGGEDYELLFALAGSARETPGGLSQRLGLPVHEIGEVVSRPGLHGLPVAPTPHHF